MKFDLNVRQMQAYAAICLLIFCNHIRVRSDAINELIKHLLAMLTTNNLPDWEQVGAKLSVTGRGDPIPAEVDEAIPQCYKDIFNTLVECCVEVGIVDMYGASTGQPMIFLERCIGIVQALGLEVPPLEYLGRLGNSDSPWGEPVSDEDLSRLMDEYGLILS